MIDLAVTHWRNGGSNKQRNLQIIIENITNSSKQYVERNPTDVVAHPHGCDNTIILCPTPLLLPLPVPLPAFHHVQPFSSPSAPQKTPDMCFSLSLHCSTRYPNPLCSAPPLQVAPQQIPPTPLKLPLSHSPNNPHSRPHQRHYPPNSIFTLRLPHNSKRSFPSPLLSSS